LHHSTPSTHARRRLKAEIERLERDVALEAGVAERTRAFMQRRIAGTQAESAQWRQTAEAKAAEQNAELQALARARQANGKSLDALRDRWRLEQADRAARDEAERLAKLELQREAEAEQRRERAARTIQIWYEDASMCDRCAPSALF
jgi:hypothetical protein